MSFEDKLTRLEEINSSMKEGGLPIEKAMKLFEEGIRLSSALEKEISRMERRVEILVNKPDTPEDKPEFELFPELTEEDKD